MVCQPYPGGLQVGMHLRTAADPRGANKDFGQCDAVNQEAARWDIQEQPCGRFLVAVEGIEMGDEDAGVQDDHAGQSWRSSSR